MSIKKSAFSLSETLLTLTIIGVIAALTIPGLKEYSDEQQYVAAAKKAYTVAQSATMMVETKYGDLRWWPWSNTEEVKNRYMAVLNTMPMSGDAYTYKSFGSSGGSGTINNTNWFQTTDGMIWRVAQAESSGASAVGTIYIDTNGAASPNVIGVDLMAFLVTNDGVYPISTGEWSCTNYVIAYGKMPWLTDSSYSSCPADNSAENPGSGQADTGESTN